MRQSSLLTALVCFGIALGPFAFAQGAAARTTGDRADLWDIPIGATVDSIDGDYVDYACGTNGGPPSTPIAGFVGFAACPEADGLREVYFRYNQTLELTARAMERPLEALRYGTSAFDFPVVASILVDEDGVVRGKRLVTDPRPEHATLRPRHEFWTLGNLLRDAFGGEGWTCVPLELGRGEHAGGTLLVKQRCEKAAEGLRYAVEQRFLQRNGQSFVDPHSGGLRPDDFESTTRFEVWDDSWRPQGSASGG